MKYTVYIITNVINKKIYIGFTSLVPAINRWKTHIAAASNTNRPMIIGRAIKKYGENNFNFQIIEQFSSKEDALKAEIFYIEKYNSTNKKIGYNITHGGAKSYQADGDRNKRKSPNRQITDAGLRKNSILDKNKVLAIKELIIKNDRTYTEISKIFNINLQTVGAIAKNKIWECVLKNYPVTNVPFGFNQRKGTKNSASKFKENDIIEIKRLAASGISCAKIAIIFSVHRKTISRIVNFHSYK